LIKTYIQTDLLSLRSSVATCIS